MLHNYFLRPKNCYFENSKTSFRILVERHTMSYSPLAIYRPVRLKTKLVGISREHCTGCTIQRWFFSTYLFCELTHCDLVIFPSSSRSTSDIQWFDYNRSLDWTHNDSLNRNVTWSGDVNWYCDGNSFNQFFWPLVQSCSRANSFESRWHEITRLFFRNSDTSHFKWCKSWYPG